MADSSQKFISRNRAPRVQIEYDVELYGAEKKVQLPFVMGVMSDLLGKSKETQPAVADRKFLEIDVENFDKRMKSMAPRAAFTVPNTLTGEGNLAVDLTFESMKDFSPGAIAHNVEALRPLLEARNQLQTLMAYMDGKSGAEELIEKILQSPALLASLSQGKNGQSEEAALALESLRGQELPEEEQDQSESVLGQLREQTTVEEVHEDRAAATLDALRQAPATQPEEADTSAEILAGLSEATVEEKREEDDSVKVALSSLESADEEPLEIGTTSEALNSLQANEPEPVSAEESVPDVLAGLAAKGEVQDQSASDRSELEALLGDLAETDLPAQEEIDQSAEVLLDLEATAEKIAEGESEAELAKALSSLPEVEPETASQEAATDAVLSDLETTEIASPESEKDEDLAAVLSTVPAAGEAPSEEETSDVLATLGETEIAEEAVEESLESILAGLEIVEEEDPAESQIEEALSSLPMGDPVPEAVSSNNEIDTALNELALGIDDLELDKSEEESARILADIEIETQSSDPDPMGELDQVLENLGEEAPAAQEIDAETALDDILSDLAELPEDEDAGDSLDDILGDLEATGDADEEPADAALDDILAGLDAAGGEASEVAEQDSADAILAGLESQEAPPTEESGLEDVLNELSEKETPEGEGSEDLELADLLGDLASDAEEAGSIEAASDDLDDILADLGDSAASVEEDAAADEAEENLGDVLAALEGSAEALEQEDGLSDILNDLSEGENKVDELFEEDPELSDLLGDLTATVETESTVDDALGDLDDILSGLGEEDADPNSDGVVGDAPAEEVLADLGEVDGDLDVADQTEEATAAAVGDEHDELDALLSDLEVGETVDDDLSVLLGETDAAEGASDLDNLLADLGIDETDASASDAENDTGPVLEPEFAYGAISADRPDPQKLIRKRFRIALLGDFSGRAARGIVEAGDALAARPEIQLDPDTVEEVIEGFKTELRLPIGKDGTAISVKLGELDDLHPDELFDNVDLFSELVALRRQLDSGVTVEHATRTLRSWAEAHATPARAPKLRSSGNAVPADRRLSDFQYLIGDQTNALGEVSPVEEMLARIVGPHIRALPDPNLPALQAAVDEALSDAMRLVLHHPEFQSIEAQWRSLDLIARSVEVGDDLEVILYDISAEEIAVDLASQDDLAETGLVRLLTEKPLDPDLGRGGYSAIIGLYKFEETPPHAELLGRIARVAAHVDAPFLASISPGFLDLPKQDRAILTAKAWDTLKSMSEAGHLGLASPRFLLRRPYGSKTDPVDAFKFEEFSETEGLRGMLWANPVVLLMILLAQSFRQNGASLQLGSIMSLGGMPYHYVTDRHGDQVALPCTERNIDLDKIAAANERGFMAISAVKGRDELRLTSFQSVAGGEILGPWTGMPAPEPSPPDPREASGPASVRASDDTAGDQGADEFDLGDLELDGQDAETNELGDLDDLLASFEDDNDDAAENGDMDAELAALLNDL